MDHCEALDLTEELEAVARMQQMPGLIVFVGTRSRQLFQISEILGGTRERGYACLVTCRGGLHRQRADGYIEAYNAKYHKQ